MNDFVTQFDQSHSTFKQKWNHYLLIAVAVVGLAGGVGLRDRSLNAVSIYNNATVGIIARYPQNWLIDTRGSYVFRVQDISRKGFKTTIQVSLQAISPNTTTRNVVDALTLNRSQLLAAYRVLPIDNDFKLPNGTTATAVNYTYAAFSPDPFLESVPIVVMGQDILTIRRGQAVVITFTSDSAHFADDYAVFIRFLTSLEY